MKQAIETLRTNWVNGDWKPTDGEHWGGAGLIITDHPTIDTALVVVTKHAGIVSSLVGELRDRLCDDLNYANKYEFYNRIGYAAKKAIEANGDSFAVIADAIFNEAATIADEWNRFLYFAYGSNMDKSQMARRCPGATLLKKAKVVDFQFAIDNRGVATIIPESDSTVEGLLYVLTKQDIEALDRYEGVAGGYYRKEILTVEADGSEYDALVYLSNAECDAPGYRPDYLERILQAAKEQKFSEQYIHRLDSMLKANRNQRNESI